MTHSTMACRAGTLAKSMRAPLAFVTRSTWARRRGEHGIADFTFGNSHAMPLAEVVTALHDWCTPLSRDWFSYQAGESHARAAVAESLRRSNGLAFEPADIALTNGGSAALSIGLKVVTDPGDEVIYTPPAWPFYRPLAVEAGLVPVPVRLDGETFDLDLDAIAAAISPRTRVIIVNTPHNPTGRMFPPATLRRLASLLDAAAARYGRSLYILSDEPFARIVFDGRRSHSPAAFYPDTLIAYSYGKVLLTPGLRLGYLAVSPAMREREVVRESVVAIQAVLGGSSPSALLQHALPDLEQLSLSVAQLARRRDRMVAALRAAGYAVHTPEATFFLLARAPWEDDAAFAELLAAHDVLVLPGHVVEMPGYLRISLTASDETIERGLPGFASAWEHASAHPFPDVASGGGRA